MDWLGLPAVKSYNGLDLQNLPLNHAYMVVNTSINNVSIYSSEDNCYNCPYKLERRLEAGEEATWQVDTSRKKTWRVLKTKHYAFLASNYRRGLQCQLRPNLGEFGVYRIDIGQCIARAEVQPVNSYFPLALCCFVLLAICVIYSIINYVISRRNKDKDLKTDKVLQINVEKEFDEGAPTLYAFRGILLSLIIFTTTGGGGYPVINIQWGGLSLSESLFSAYAWSVGYNIPKIIATAFNRQSKCAIVGDIIMRSSFLIILGSVIDSTVDNQAHKGLNILWCPLQKLGIAYLLVASAYVLTVQRYEIKSKYLICKAASNFYCLLWCWIISGFLLAVISIMISTFISFNCLSNASHRLEYSDIQSEVSLNCNNAVTEYANRIFIGESKKMVDVTGYLGFSGGVMGIMTTIMHTMLGLKAGVVYLQYQSHMDRLKLWALWAMLFGFGGVCFAAVSHTLNFNMWPISTIFLLTTSFLYLFTLVYILTEVWNITSPILITYGVTSLIIFSSHLLFSNSAPFHWGIQFRNHLYYILQNFWIILLWLIVSFVLSKKKVKFDI